MTRIGEPPTVVERGALADAPPLMAARMQSTPYPTLDVRVQPSIATGRRRANYVAFVANASSVPAQARLSVLCGDGVRALVAPAVL
jgi:hypothetical protein